MASNCSELPWSVRWDCDSVAEKNDEADHENCLGIALVSTVELRVDRLS